MSTSTIAAALAAALALAAGGCLPVATQELERDRPAEPEIPFPEAAGGGEGEMWSGLAQVDQVDVAVSATPPPVAHVRVLGFLNDGCTRLAERRVERVARGFEVTLATARPAHAICTQALVPFETSVELDLSGLEPGVYTVRVNGRGAALRVPEPAGG